MNNHSLRAGRFRELFAIGALLVASIVSFSPVAQAQAPTISGPHATVAAVSGQDIREIRGPKPIMSAWLIPLIALSTLLTGAAFWAVWAWYRRRPPLFLQTPAEIALARLEYARGLMQPALCREFSIEVSSVVREFIESRFRLMAAHLTTHEFLHELLNSGDPVLTVNRPLLAEFMERCDLAKFGGWTLPIPEMEAMFESARHFVVDAVADSGRQDSGTRPASIPTASAITPRETYDSLPST